MKVKERFAKAINSQFHHLGREATYIIHNGSEQSIHVIARRSEQLFELGEGKMHGEKPQLEFRLSEVASPSRGDEIHIDGRVYRIEEEPRLDLHQLIWAVDCVPINNSQ